MRYAYVLPSFFLPAMKILILITVILFSFFSWNTDPTESVWETELIIQKVLDSPELHPYFSLQPRFISNNTTFYFMIDNEATKDVSRLSILNHKVAIVPLSEIQNRNIKYFIEINSLYIENNLASLSLTYNNPILFQKENKIISADIKLKKEQKDWIITESRISEIEQE
jgi:hypothetical protein